MAENNLTQNEIFQLVGNYQRMPVLKPEPAGRTLSRDSQLSLLKSNIEKCGIVKTAESWKNYADPGIRSALKLTASGMEIEQIKSLLDTAALGGDKIKLKQQLLFNRKILSILTE